MSSISLRASSIATRCLLVPTALAVSVLMSGPVWSSENATATAVRPMITAGAGHTCATDAIGALVCWGYNAYGQAPQKVAGVPRTGGIAAGYLHTCAIVRGALKCWGNNYSGALGIGTNSGSYAQPMQVLGLTSGITAVAADYLRGCAALGSGGARCWGYNYYGQVGNGNYQDQFRPVTVRRLTERVLQIALGQHHSCALLLGGSVKCWGRGLSGELGNGTNSDSLWPVQVTGLTRGVKQITASHQGSMCALLKDGSVKCWGSNSFGQLGTGTLQYSYVPKSVIGLAEPVTALAMGANHTCAALLNGGAMCWGINRDGELGNGKWVNSTVPVRVSNLTETVVAIAAGDYNSHTCVLTNTGAAKCWGHNEQGQLGDGTTQTRNVPITVKNFVGPASPR